MAEIEVEVKFTDSEDRDIPGLWLRFPYSTSPTAAFSEKELMIAVAEGITEYSTELEN